MTKKVCCFFISAFFTVLLSACDSVTEASFFMMDTVMDLKVWGSGADEVVSDIEDVLAELDRDLSPYCEEGVLARINRGESVKDERVSEVVSVALEFSEETEGAFSPLLGTVIELWDVGGKNYLPSEEERKKALGSAELKNISISDGKIQLSEGAQINLGAVAKGYASDIIRAKLVENGVKRAVISLGGNVYVHGTREDKRPWNVALRDPQGGENDWFGILRLSDKFVISSGDYERYFEQDGVRYHHIFDPETGAPAKSDLLSVTVICENGALGDAYSTALYIMGRERALEFWRRNKDFELVLVGCDGVVTATEGICDAFTLSDGGYMYEIARR